MMKARTEGKTSDHEVWFNRALLSLAATVATIVLCPGGCGIDQDNGSSDEYPETPVTVIQLDGPLAQDKSEVSGLAWYGEYLVVLPQYPGVFSDDTHGAVFALHRTDIVAFLDGSTGDPVDPIRIPFDDSALDSALVDVEFFQGYEAIAFIGDRAFLTIEAWTSSGLSGYLVSGTIDPALSCLTVHADPVVQIASQSGLSNMAEETLIAAGNGVVTIHEANGTAINPSPVAHTYDTSSNATGTIAFPNIEYRITDATTLDADERFWAVNYFWPGESMLKPDADPLAEQFREGETHAEKDHVERLVEFQYDNSGITLTPNPPIQLELTDDPRNWEGLVRLDNSGFLLMTDKHPEAILGFVPTK